MLCGTHKEPQPPQAPRRVSEEGGALAATPQHTLDRRALPSRWWAPGPSPRGTTRRTEDASGDRGRLSPPTGERQTGDAPTQ